MSQAVVQIGDRQDPHALILPYPSSWQLPIDTAGMIDQRPRCVRAA
jgi:hypothetical protein